MDYKKKTYLTLIISAIIIIALLLFLVGKLVRNIKSSSSEILKTKSAVFSYKERSEKYLKDIKDAYAKVEPKISEINNAFVNPEKAIDFIVAIERVAAQTNNYQEIREIASPDKKEGALYFQISLWGSFPNLIKFLAQLENMNYFVDSNSLQIMRIDEKELAGFIDKGTIVSTGDVKSIINIKTHTQW